ncbi:hypothetical protein BC936DRAFT_138954 [Jimgerdemannia flammicorona]|uniref:Uncharacterized protein n=2 Tax=Jimgerdemannia flammicorona TaxID=994334 RepID=A0A433BCF9_9FUNG|nr:hypothetical protein BC936DRAFT_138954 [Jimgerdemannia flammicorona]RUP24023.1 hypothetical protein BC936DRAFT_138954 [Jimgerdemannia flammicorona]RUS31729.1 hypothetical protein BC938DRAFT_477219 [Jimgerdemannia flammicorona]
MSRHRGQFRQERETCTSIYVKMCFSQGPSLQSLQRSSATRQDCARYFRVPRMSTCTEGLPARVLTYHVLGDVQNGNDGPRFTYILVGMGQFGQTLCREQCESEKTSLPPLIVLIRVHRSACLKV